MEKQRKNNKVGQQERELVNAKTRKVRAGETWTINDRRTAGHKSTITKVKNDEVRHIPRTHSPTTRKHKNIKLQENPQKGDVEDSYIVRKVQITNIRKIGKQQKNQDIKNPIDKSVIRHIKKQDKKRKK